MMAPGPPDERAGEPQSSGRSMDPERDHERRIRTLEAAQAALVASVATVRREQRSLRWDLFGNPERADEGGKGAFSRLEGLIEEVQGAVERVNQHRSAWSGRWVQLGGYLAVGLVVAVTSFLLSRIPPVHP